MRPAAIVAALSLLAVAGCSGANDHTPVACLESASAYLRALRQTPGEVRLRDETPISACLAQNQSGGDLAGVGAAMVTAATRLDAAARAHPGGAANVQLGYLLGAAARGAGETEGIHADLIRRLTAAARYSPGGQPLPQAFRVALRRGYDAGTAAG